MLTCRVFDSSNRRSGARFDAYRIDDHVFIDIDLPGAEPAGIDVSGDQRALTLRAGRSPAADGTAQVSLSGELDTDRLEARYDDGVLTLRIPMR